MGVICACALQAGRGTTALETENDADEFEPPITAKNLAEAGLPILYLDKLFREEHAYFWAEFCHPWENISYRLKPLTKEL